MKQLVLFWLSMLISSNSGANILCRSDPSTDDDQQVIDDGSTFQLACELHDINHRDHMQACSWQHYEPLNENRGQNYPPDVECNYASSVSTTCIGERGDTRITGTVNQGSCQIMVSNSKPEDTGEWMATVITVSYLIKLVYDYLNLFLNAFTQIFLMLLII